MVGKRTPLKATAINFDTGRMDLSALAKLLLTHHKQSGAAEPRPMTGDIEPVPPAPLSEEKRALLAAASRAVEYLNDDQAAAFAVLLEQAAGEGKKARAG